MPTITIDATVKGEAAIELQDIADQHILAEARCRASVLRELESDFRDNLDPPNARDFSASDLIDALNAKKVDHLSGIRTAYRLMAEGDAAAAMDALHEEFPSLPPPSHEKKIATRIAGREAIHA